MLTLLFSHLHILPILLPNSLLSHIDCLLYLLPFFHILFLHLTQLLLFLPFTILNPLLLFYLLFSFLPYTLLLLFHIPLSSVFLSLLSSSLTHQLCSSTPSLSPTNSQTL